MNKRAILNLTVWVLTSNGLASTIVAQEIKWIVPAAARDQEGDLETSSEGGTGGIFHGLVHAADFNDLPTDYKYITQLSFRPNASVTTPMELKYDNLKIRLSTTSRDSLSTNYAGKHWTGRYHYLRRFHLVYYRRRRPPWGPEELLRASSRQKTSCRSTTIPVRVIF